MSKANIVLGIMLTAVLAVAFAFVLEPAPDDPGRLRAVVHDGDGGTHELPLAIDGEVTVATGKGTNVVAVEDGAVFVRSADCDNHDCIHQGKLDAPGKQIICLPHELWIEVVADGAETGRMDVDAATGEPGNVDIVAR